MQELQQAGVAAGAVLRPTALLHDPALVERGFWRTLERAHVGPKPHPLTPWRFNGERGALRSPSPLLGEHNEAVFSGILGLSSEEIRALEAQGVIGDQPVVARPPKI